ncbi:MAG: HNH endonuclease [Candidatus Promineofilum sp.]|nr:HNH endonuclease [Promineifilum sp.]
MAESTLQHAKTNKADEFYTQLSDIEAEMRHYQAHFRDKVVFCNCDDPHANELWTYFRNVIEWVKLTFPNYRKEMKGIDWGALYDEFHGRLLDIARLEQQVKALMADDDVTKKKGIYAYVLTGDERHLNIRVFSDNQKREAYERQNGVCHSCRQRFELSQMEADHITPWSKGGKTSAANCQMLCLDCNRRKSAV